MKMKTKKIVAKRFNVTKRGIILRGKQNAQHLRSHKSAEQLRRFKNPGKVSKGLTRAIRTFLPYQAKGGIYG